MFTSLVFATSAIAAVRCFSNSSFSSAHLTTLGVWRVFLWSSSLLSTSSFLAHFYEDPKKKSGFCQSSVEKKKSIFSTTNHSNSIGIYQVVQGQETFKGKNDSNILKKYFFFFSHLTKWHKRRGSAFCSNMVPAVFCQTLYVKQYENIKIFENF